MPRPAVHHKPFFGMTLRLPRLRPPLTASFCLLLQRHSPPQIPHQHALPRLPLRKRIQRHKKRLRLPRPHPLPPHRRAPIKHRLHHVLPRRPLQHHHAAPLSPRALREQPLPRRAARFLPPGGDGGRRGRGGFGVGEELRTTEVGEGAEVGADEDKGVKRGPAEEGLAGVDVGDGGDAAGFEVVLGDELQALRVQAPHPQRLHRKVIEHNMQHRQPQKPRDWQPRILLLNPLQPIRRNRPNKQSQQRDGGLLRALLRRDVGLVTAQREVGVEGRAGRAGRDAAEAEENVGEDVGGVEPPRGEKNRNRGDDQPKIIYRVRKHPPLLRLRVKRRPHPRGERHPSEHPAPVAPHPPQRRRRGPRRRVPDPQPRQGGRRAHDLS
mmetsp:Transcript_18647/g.46806  ORF Transcript_18647/g.46806 Transcript_18647/m.46806 type:complete len:380 (+) Transcript_18647:370-1509(+)